MENSQNPLRIFAQNKYGVDSGPSTLLANGLYDIDDIVQPLVTESAMMGDPRLYISVGARKSKLTWNKVDKGWISPKHKAGNDKDTVLQIKFNKPRKLNRISFELLRVPQEWKVFYYDSARQKMVHLSDVDGKKVEGSLSGFRINTVTPKNGDQTNQRKWRLYSYILPKVTTSIIEIRLNREIENPPINNLDSFYGLDNDTPYSLGIRHLKLKMAKNQDDDDDDDDDGCDTPIGTTERPVVTRYTSERANDDANTTYWECGPQGAANSVVPFYIDARNEDWSASLFDCMKLVPLWPGPSMNIYWSNDEVTTPWSVSPNRVTTGQAGTVTTSVVPDVGLYVSSIDSAGLLDNAKVRMDPGNDFVVGMEFTPQTSNATDKFLWDFEEGGGDTVGFKFDPTSFGGGTQNGQFKVVQNGVTLFASSSYSLNEGTKYSVVLGYNKTDSNPAYPRGFYLLVNGAMEFGTFANITVTDIEDIYIGNKAALSTPCSGYIANMWMRLDSYDDHYAKAFASNPENFVKGAGDPAQRVHGHYNAVFTARFKKTLEARVGPGAGFFRNKSWTPIPVDYSLATDRYEFPIVNAKYLKLEFSNLVPRVYMTEVEFLPVCKFPKVIRDYHVSSRGNKTAPYPLITQRNLFEGIIRTPTPGDPRKLPAVRANLEGRGGGGVPTIIYHRDQSTADFAVNPAGFDDTTAYRELEEAVTPLRFHRAGRHEYETEYVSVQRRAFFVGIKELSLLRRDHSVQFDTPEYIDTFEDDANLADTDNFINVGGSFQAQNVGDALTSKPLLSFSKFETVQVAGLDQGWESVMTPEQIDISTLTHLTDLQDDPLDSSATMVTTVVTGQYQGARRGNVLKLTREPGSVDDYGLRTVGNLFGVSPITGDNPRVSAVVRMQLPETNNGTYELRLYADNSSNPGSRIVISKQIKMPTKSWREIEIAYVALDDDQGWQAELVQLDSGVSEPLIVDMLGIWENPIKWEVSNDNGANWQTLLTPLNKPNGYIRFNTADHRLKFRVTALRDNAIAGGISIVPWYLDSSMVIRAPIDYNPPWGVSDDQDLHDTSHKPMFQIWSHFYPQKYSVNLVGVPSIKIA